MNRSFAPSTQRYLVFYCPYHAAPTTGGMYGKLGHGNEAGHSTPKRVEALTGLVVSQIACGSRHTAAVVSSGALYSWGDKEVSFKFCLALEATLRSDLTPS